MFLVTLGATEHNGAMDPTDSGLLLRQLSGGFEKYLCCMLARYAIQESSVIFSDSIGSYRLTGSQVDSGVSYMAD